MTIDICGDTYEGADEVCELGNDVDIVFEPGVTGADTNKGLRTLKGPA